MSAQLAIQSAIVAALLQAPAVAGGNVRANVVRPLSAAQPNAAVVRMLSSVASAGMLGSPRQWSTQFAVECLARSSAPLGDPVAATDAVLTAVWQRLSALTMPELAVSEVAIQPSISWQVDDLDTPVAAAVLQLTVSHRTKPTTLEIA